MSDVPAERIALHIVHHLDRGLGKTEGQGASIQSLRHWWTLSLGQRGESFEWGLKYAGDRLWIERGSENFAVGNESALRCGWHNSLIGDERSEAMQVPWKVRLWRRHAAERPLL
jgi:hypothetical protein